MEKNEISVINNASNAVATTEDYKNIAIQYLTSTGNLKKFTENEKAQFCDICCAFGLNPIKKEVYGVKYGDNFNIIVGYETYLKRADRTGKLDGFNTTVEKVGDDMKAVCTIYRKDWARPFIHEVYMSEYNTKKSLWVSKPITMIKKVAEAQAFRKCFPDEMGGLPYTSEELPDIVDNIGQEDRAAKAPTKAAKPSTKASAELPKINTKKESNNLPFTKEEAEELAAIMKATDENGREYFNEKDKANYREMLKAGQAQDAITSAKILLKDRKLQAEAEEVEAVVLTTTKADADRAGFPEESAAVDATAPLF